MTEWSESELPLVVMWAGVGIAKDTLEPLIGEAIDPQVYDQIKAFVEKIRRHCRNA